MMKSDWQELNATTKQCATATGAVFIQYGSDGLRMGLVSTESKAYMTLPPADALALARDILKEYGGRG